MVKKICSVDGCDGKHKSLGFCSMHYWRHKKYGDARGGVHSGTRGRFYEEVVLTYDGYDCLIWPFSKKGGNGYAIFGRRSDLVHRMVCEKVHGPKPFFDAQVAHSCGNGQLGCVAMKHVRWASRSENETDKVEHGKSNRGNRNGMSKLSPEDVKNIRRLSSSLSTVEIASKYGLHRNTVFDIVNRRRWAWLD